MCGRVEPQLNEMKLIDPALVVELFKFIRKIKTVMVAFNEIRSRYVVLLHYT
jgi:hypothetical protein